jgi:hypothetical protein
VVRTSEGSAVYLGESGKKIPPIAETARLTVAVLSALGEEETADTRTSGARSDMSWQEKFLSLVQQAEVRT